MNQSITPLVMPKWGLSMKEGDALGLACRGRADDHPRSRRSWTSRRTRSRTRWAAEGGLLRRRIGEDRADIPGEGAPGSDGTG